MSERYEWLISLPMPAVQAFANLAVALRTDVAWLEKAMVQLIYVDSSLPETKRSVIAFLPAKVDNQGQTIMAIHGENAVTNPVGNWILNEIMHAGWEVEAYRPNDSDDEKFVPGDRYQHIKG